MRSLFGDWVDINVTVTVARTEAGHLVVLVLGHCWEWEGKGSPLSTFGERGQQHAQGEGRGRTELMRRDEICPGQKAGTLGSQEAKDRIRGDFDL